MLGFMIIRMSKIHNLGQGCQQNITHEQIFKHGFISIYLYINKVFRGHAVRYTSISSLVALLFNPVPQSYHVQSTLLLLRFPMCPFVVKKHWKDSLLS